MPVKSCWKISCFHSGTARTRSPAPLNVPPRRIYEIVLGKRSVTADTAVRLAAALGTGERFWLGLQADYSLEKAHRALGKKAIERIERIADFCQQTE